MKIRQVLFFLTLLLFSLPALSMEPFDQCLMQLQQRAQQQGLADNLVTLLASLKPIERVIEYDRNQPEFVQTFAEYLSRRVNDERVNRGRELLHQYRPLLAQLADKYGIPPQYIMAFWGLETNFGAYLGKMSTLDSLATLACDQRRSEFFTRELFIALEITEQHKLAIEDMQGSWAGAMGHTQFMPSAYQRYAVDGDGDGRADLWNSIPDALTSAANFLQQLGWVRNQRWGREVQLPTTFDYVNADSTLWLQQWDQLGVVRANGRALPRLQEDIKAELVIPSGEKGPKFLVYQNFEVIMRWNRSVYYALAVGHLADRINGAGRLAVMPPISERLTTEDVKTLQQLLRQQGFDPGQVDGRLGPATQSAIRAFQLNRGVVADGFADRELLRQLR